MSEKPIDWRGSSLRDIKDEDIFTPNARKEAGHQLSRVQAGLESDDWKPFDVVGAGTKEIRINHRRWLVPRDVRRQVSNIPRCS